MIQINWLWQGKFPQNKSSETRQLMCTLCVLNKTSIKLILWCWFVTASVLVSCSWGFFFQFLYQTTLKKDVEECSAFRKQTNKTPTVHFLYGLKEIVAITKNTEDSPNNLTLAVEVFQGEWFIKSRVSYCSTECVLKKE